jgi:hypothetical protein
MSFNLGDVLPWAGIGLSIYSGMEQGKQIALSAGAQAKASLEQAKLYRQNAKYEAINAGKRTDSIRLSYKRIQDKIDATSRASGFKTSGELKREADLNKRRAIQESRFGSAMMMRNYTMAAKRSVEQGRQAIQGIKYQQRANLLETGVNVLDYSSRAFYS